MARDRTGHSHKTATSKSNPKPFCRNLPRPAPQLPPSVASDPLRAAAIIRTRSKWVNGTVLHYCFFNSGHYAVPEAQSDAVRGAFETWKSVGIGLGFQEVNQLSEAEVR